MRRRDKFDGLFYTAKYAIVSERVRVFCRVVLLKQNTKNSTKLELS